MKIINAVWEKRNLGVNCNEVEIENKDTVKILKQNLEVYETEYTVIKVPIGMIEISQYLQSAGYTFMELMISCSNNGQLPLLTPIQKRIIDSVSYKKMNNKDIEQLFVEIDSGMFTDDRVSLDLKFTQDQANNRYAGWVSDEIELGSKFFKLVYKSQTAGFFSLKANGDDCYTSSLGGLYPSFERVGFGICLNYFTIKEGIKQNAKKIFTSFSSNNRGAFGIHFSIGYNIGKLFYVFIKHK